MDELTSRYCLNNGYGTRVFPEGTITSTSTSSMSKAAVEVSDSREIIRDGLPLTAASQRRSRSGAHFIKVQSDLVSYVQVTGNGDFTKINIPAGDDGGELDVSPCLPFIGLPQATHPLGTT